MARRDDGIYLRSERGGCSRSCWILAGAVCAFYWFIP
jgi:hypothetical protein